MAITENERRLQSNLEKAHWRIAELENNLSIQESLDTIQLSLDRIEAILKLAGNTIKQEGTHKKLERKP